MVLGVKRVVGLHGLGHRAQGLRLRLLECSWVPWVGPDMDSEVLD